MNFAAFALANLLGGYARGRRERTEFEEEKRNRDRTLRLSEERLDEERERRKWEQEQAAYKRDWDEYTQWRESAQAAAKDLNRGAVVSAVEQANRIAEKRGFTKLDPDMFQPGVGTVAEHLGKFAQAGLPWSAVAPGVHWALGTQEPPPAGAPAPGPAFPLPAAAAPVTPSLGVAAALRPAESAIPGGALRWPPSAGASLPPPAGPAGVPAPAPAPIPSPDLLKELKEAYAKTRRREDVKHIVDDLVRLSAAGATGEELRNFLAVATGEGEPGEAIKGSGLSLRQGEIESKTEKNRSEARLNTAQAEYTLNKMLLEEERLKLEAKKAEREWWLNQQDLALRKRALEARLALADKQQEIASFLADLKAREFEHKRWRDLGNLSARYFETAALSASWDTPLNQDIAKDAWQRAKDLPVPGVGAPPAKAAPPAPSAPPAQRKTGSSLSPEDRQLYQWRKHGLVLPDGKKVGPAEVDQFVRKAMLDKKSNAQIVAILRRWGAR